MDEHLRAVKLASKSALDVTGIHCTQSKNGTGIHTLN